MFEWVRVGAAGASGFCAVGVALAAVDQPLSPTLLAARTCTWYAVSLVRLPRVTDVVVSDVVSPVRSVQSPQVGLVAHVSTALSPPVAVHARYRTS